MIEGCNEALIAGIEQIRHEAIERAPRVDDRLTPHAVADVEEDADADRRPLVGKLRHWLRITVLEDFEVVLREAHDEAAGVIGDGDGNLDGGDTAVKGLR